MYRLGRGGFKYFIAAELLCSSPLSSMCQCVYSPSRNAFRSLSESTRGLTAGTPSTNSGFGLCAPRRRPTRRNTMILKSSQATAMIPTLAARDQARSGPGHALSDREHRYRRDQ